MATPVTFNGVVYSIPAFGDTGYAQGSGNLSAYLIALAGGPFPFTSQTVNPATAGQIRLAKTDTIDWRNNVNSGNLPLGINDSDQLTFNGTILATNGGISSGTAGNLTLYPATGANLSDTYTQNGHSIKLHIATQGSRSADLIYTLPNPGNAATAATVALSDVNQSITGTYTFNVQPAFTNGFQSNGICSFGGTVNLLDGSGILHLPGYTVSTLPVGVLGDMAFVSDATAPTYNGALTGGGTVAVPVFFNGSSWVSH